MLEASFFTPNVVLAYSVYALGTASPGPSNLSVMATAMQHGRRPALTFALGVVSGSALWGFLAAVGLSSLLAQYSQALVSMKVLGGLYLLWVAVKSARSALKPAQPFAKDTPQSSTRSLYLRGAAMHLTNPKAIFVWLAIVSLALPAGSSHSEAVLIVVGCVPIGLAVFCSYALVFSTAAARHAYLRVRRWFDGALGVLFGYAGVRMLLSRRAV